MRTKQYKSKIQKYLYSTVAFCVLLAPTGCRSTQDNQIDLLERELRSQEDYIYELEDYVVEYSEKLRECRCTSPQTRIIKSSPKKEKSITKKPSASTQSSRENSQEDVFEENESSLPAPEELEIDMEPEEEFEPIPESINLEDLEAPELDISDPLSEVNEDTNPGAEFAAAVDVFEAEFQEIQPINYETEVQYQEEEAFEEVEYLEEQDQEGSQLVYIPDPNTFQEQADKGQQEEALHIQEEIELVTSEEKSILKERNAERIVVTQLFRGSGVRDLPESLLTVVEARDAYDEPADFEGEISLMIMTSDLDAPQRIHRWDFTKEETQMAWQSSEMGDGLHLELPLKKTELPQEKIELWVRLLMADGRKLLTQLPFETRTLVALDDTNSTEEALAEAKPLKSAGDEDSVELGLVAENEANSSILRSSTIGKTEKTSKDKPRWRASMQSTQSVATKSYSTNSPGSMRWKAQPAGGRMPYQPSMATRPIKIDKAADNSPQWQPFR